MHHFMDSTTLVKHCSDLENVMEKWRLPVKYMYSFWFDVILPQDSFGKIIMCHKLLYIIISYYTWLVMMRFVMNNGEQPILINFD